VEAAKGTLVIDERVPARARLRAVWKSLAAFVPTTELGDPMAGGTSYGLCVYGAADALVGTLEIDRAGASCGVPAKPCWKTTGSTGFRYSDRNATVHGLRRLVLKGGAAGKGKIALKAKVQPGRSLSGLPPGIPAALVGSGEVTAQIVSSDAGCFTLTTNVVSGADGQRFSGRRR